LEEEVTAIRKRISQQHQEELQKLEAENEHLRHKVKEFEKKFQAIIPEV
jgi:cell division protein FtsB